MSLGSAGGGKYLDLDVAAAGNTEVIRANPVWYGPSGNGDIPVIAVPRDRWAAPGDRQARTAAAAAQCRSRCGTRSMGRSSGKNSLAPSTVITPVAPGMVSRSQ
jgi:hypothetical protein